MVHYQLDHQQHQIQAMLVQLMLHLHQVNHQKVPALQLLLTLHQMHLQLQITQLPLQIHFLLALQNH